MPVRPVDVMNAFPLGKSRKQTAIFFSAVQSYAQDLAYCCTEETSLGGISNLIIGDPQKSCYVVLCGVCRSAAVLTLELMRNLPENRRDRVCFVFHADSPISVRAYCRNQIDALSHQIVFRLGDISEGDVIRMFPTKQLNLDRKKLTSLYKACGYFGKKSLLVQEKSHLASLTPFPYGVGVCTVKPGKKETYANRCRNAQMPPEETNINILRAALISFFCCDAAQ